MTLTDLRAFIAAAPWKFARTMPTNPHWYTVRGQTPEDQFEAVVTYIRANGSKKTFGKTVYIYLDLDGFSYWTMGAPLDKTIIINRAKADPYSGFGACS